MCGSWLWISFYSSEERFCILFRLLVQNLERRRIAQMAAKVQSIDMSVSESIDLSNNVPDAILSAPYGKSSIGILAKGSSAYTSRMNTAYHVLMDT